jgi:hypothetical protein
MFPPRLVAAQSPSPELLGAWPLSATLDWDGTAICRPNQPGSGRKLRQLASTTRLGRYQ